MRRRHLLLSTCIALPVALGALAQAEGERQFDAAANRLRAALGPEGAVEWRSRSIDPVNGTVRLEGLAIRRGAERLTAEEATLSDLRADRLGRAVFSTLRLEEPGKEGRGPSVLTAGRVTLGTLALPAGTGQGGVDWAAAAVEEAVGEGLRLDMPGQGDMELGRVTVSGYAPGTAREVVAEGYRFTDRSDGETRMQLGRARLAGAELPRPGEPFDPWILSADAALLEGAELSVEKAHVALRLGRAQVDGWGKGRLTTLAVEGVEVAGDSPETGPFTAQLGRAGTSGVPLRDLTYAITHDVNPPRSIPGQEQSALLEGLSVSANGTPLVRIGSVRANNTWDAATEVGSLSVEGLAIDPPPDYGGSWLNGLGYKGVSARMGVSTRLEEGAGRLLTDPYTLQATGMGSLGLMLDLRGVQVPTPGEPSASRDDPFALIGKWSVAAMTLRYTDEGLLRAIVAQQATQERVPDRQVRERYAQMALRTPLPGVAPGKEAPTVRRVREAWASFARDLGTIEIAMRPSQPVPALDIMGAVAVPPEQAIRNLGITVTARK